MTEVQSDSPIPVASLLASLAIFGGLGEQALEEIRKRLQCHRLQKGTFVLREGESDKNVYIIRTGSVEVLKRDPSGLHPPCQLAVLGAGACFGEMALVDVMPRSASVRTLEDSMLLSFSNTDLFDFYQLDLESFTLVMMNLAREISRRLRRADTLLHEFGVQTVDVPEAEEG